MDPYSQELAKLALLAQSPQGADFLKGLQAQSSQSGAARALTPSLQKGNVTTVVGGVSVGAVSQSDTGLLEPFTITYTAPTSGAKWLIIGNNGNIITDALGISSGDIADYSGAGNTWSYTALKTFAQNGFTIATINYSVVAQAQYANTLKKVTIALDGSVVQNPLNGRVTAAFNPMDNQTLIRILDMSNGQILINNQNALALQVGAGQYVSLTITPGASRS